MSHILPIDNKNLPSTGAACVICLDTRLKDPTILDGCQHFFCYDCINQWLLTNPSCPMCKKHLHNIKHNLSPLPETFPVAYDSVNGIEKSVEESLTDYEMSFLRDLNYTPLVLEKKCIDDALDEEYSKSVRIRRLHVDRDLSDQEYESRRAISDENIKRLTQLKALIANRSKRSIIYGNREFRRLIYTANLNPRCRLSPRFPADASPSGIEANEKLFRKRLNPYLIREFSAILPRTAIDISSYIDLVIKYLKATERKNKANILHKLQRSGLTHPQHFLNNVSHFLSSGQKLEVYDENCEFMRRGANSDIRSFLSGRDDDDVEFLSETVTLDSNPIDTWTTNMRQEYYRGIATNPPAPTNNNNNNGPSSSSNNNIITIDDGATNDDDNFVVIDDESPIRNNNTINLSDGEDDDDDDSIFTHPALMMRSYTDRSPFLRSNMRHNSAVREISPLSIFGASRNNALSNIYNDYTSNSATHFNRSYLPRNQTPSAPTSHNFADLHQRLNIFDGLGRYMRNREGNMLPSRSRSSVRSRSHSPLEESNSNNSAANPVITNLSESDSDVEVVSQTSSSRKRPRLEDIH